jgi:glutamine synthetase
VREAVVATKAIRFEGNNYSAEWVEEARRRGIPNLRQSPEALAELVKPEAKEFMARMKVFSEAETEARYHVRMERYVKDVEIEVEALKSIVTSHVLPAAYKQLALLGAAGSARSSKDALGRMDAAVDAVASKVAALQSSAERATGEGDPARKSRILADEVVPAMAALREASDRIEEMVADEFWTLPKYSEMLFLV